MREEEDCIITDQSIWLKSYSKPSSEWITFQIPNSHNRIMKISFLQSVSEYIERILLH